jgi:hypothetical protein
MSITRTALGTNTATSSPTSIQKTGVTLADGDTMLVAVSYKGSAAPALSSDWGGTGLTELPSSPKFNGTERLSVYVLQNASAGTHDVTVTFDDAPLNAAIAVVGLSNVAAASYDVGSGGAGSSTTPSSGSSGTLAQAAEMAVAFVGTGGPSGDTAGSWSNSFTAGQRAGTTGGTATNNATISEGYLQTAATTAVTGAKTGITSRSWAAIVATFKEQTSTTVSGGSMVGTLIASSATPSPGAYSQAGGALDATLVASGAAASPGAYSQAGASVAGTLIASGATASPGAHSEGGGGVTGTLIAGSATPVGGPYTQDGGSMVATLIASAGAAAPGVREVAGSEVLATAVMSEVVARGGLAETVHGNLDPEAVTTKYVVVPVTPANMGDADASTSTVTGKNPGGASAGDLENVATVVSDIPPGIMVDDISHVIVRAACWYQEPASIPPEHWTAPRIIYTVDGVTATQTVTNDGVALDAGLASWPIHRQPDGLSPGDVADDRFWIRTGEIATQPNGDPWTVDAIAALTNLGLRVTWNDAAAFMELAVAEVVVEVYTALGTQRETVEATLPIAQAVKRLTLTSTVEG